jgi:hypothetical protein
MGRANALDFGARWQSTAPKASGALERTAIPPYSEQSRAFESGASRAQSKTWRVFVSVFWLLAIGSSLELGVWFLVFVLLKHHLRVRVFPVRRLMARRPFAFLEILGFDVQRPIGHQFAGAAHFGYAVGIAGNCLVGDPF